MLRRMQDRKAARLEEFWTVGIRTGGSQDRRDSGQEGRWTGGT